MPVSHNAGASRTGTGQRPQQIRALPALLLSLLHLACAKDKPTGPDSTAPAAVGAFTATVRGSDTVLLSWTAPGDDGNSGKATAYEVRRSPSRITHESFSQSDSIGAPPAPAAAGTPQQLYATNLPGGSIQYFAIRTSDERGNWSRLSLAGPIQTPPDTIPPAAITDLRIQSITDTSVTLAWTAPGDDGRRGRVTGYEIRFQGGTLSAASWDAAHIPAHAGVSPSAPGATEVIEVGGITPRVLVQLAVSATDETGNHSPISNRVSAKLRASPREWFVQANGMGSASTVQAGMDSALDGDAVMVGPGTYHELIDFKGKAIEVVSTQGPEMTILDGTGLNGPTVSFRAAEARASLIQGFTITGGSGFVATATKKEGGGVSCFMSSPTIRGNIIRDNHLPERSSRGGGIGVFGSLETSAIQNPLIQDNLIVRNSVGGNGGGVAIVYSSATLTDNTFRQNTCGYDGGGLWGYLLRGGLALEGGLFEENVAGDHGGAVEADNAAEHLVASYEIHHVVFVRNVANGRDLPEEDAGSGGAVSARGTQGHITHNTFVDNQGIRGDFSCPGGALLIFAPTGPMAVSFNAFVGSVGCGVACYSSPEATLEHNLFWTNAPQDVGRVGEGCAGNQQASNVFLDPGFCNAESGDYRLTAASPATIQGEVIGAYDELGCVEPQKPLH